MVEPLGHGEPPAVPGLQADVGEHLVHAAELGAEHRLHLGGAQPGRTGVDPPGEPQQHVAGLRVADQPPDVEQPGERLVDAVVGHVAVGQGARFQGGEVRLREAGQVAVRRLARGQLGDHVVRLVAADGVTERGPRLGPRGQEVALHVRPEREARRVPATVGGRAAGGPAVVGPEVVEQPVDVDESQVVQGAGLVVQPPSGGEPDLAESERIGRDADVGASSGRGEAGQADRDHAGAPGLQQPAAADVRCHVELLGAHQGVVRSKRLTVTAPPSAWVA